jgi:homoaconitase
VILTLAGRLTVRGGTGSVLEYFGKGVEGLSCTGMATMSNMGAEMGATTSVFPYTPAMYDYLKATRRGAIAEKAKWAHAQGLLVADAKAEYSQVIELDLSRIEPMISAFVDDWIALNISLF